MATPLFAQEVQAPVGQGGHFFAMQEGRHENFQKAHSARMEKMKATQDKVAKLVKEYNKLKGKKQEAKKAEITALVTSIRDEQLAFNEKQLELFEERLTQMKDRLEQDKSAEAKKTWVEEKTTQLIAQEGDMKVLFDHGGQVLPSDEKPHHMGCAGMGGHHFGKGKCPCAKGGKGVKNEKPCMCKDHCKCGPREGINPPPPPPLTDR